MTQTITTERKRRPRIAKGLLVTSTNEARRACIKQYLTVYIFRPFSYKLVRQVIIDLPLIN